MILAKPMPLRFISDFVNDLILPNIERVTFFLMKRRWMLPGFNFQLLEHPSF